MIGALCFLAVLSASASCGRRSSASAPFPVSISTKVSTDRTPQPQRSGRAPLVAPRGRGRSALCSRSRHGCMRWRFSQVWALLRHTVTVDALLARKGEELQRGTARAHFAALPPADDYCAHVQRQSEGRLAHVRLLANMPDRRGRQKLHGRQTALVLLSYICANLLRLWIW